MTQTKEIQVTQFSDVKSRVDYMLGYAQVIRKMAEKNNVPVEFNGVSAERSIRKSVAKHVGKTSKYDGRGNLQEIGYPELSKDKQFKFGQKLTIEDLFGEH